MLKKMELNYAGSTNTGGPPWWPAAPHPHPNLDESVSLSRVPHKKLSWSKMGEYDGIWLVTQFLALLENVQLEL